jgi:two-component system OmpR family sensor kinase
LRGRCPGSRASPSAWDLLLLARLDEGRPLAREHVELGRVVGEAVDAARVVDAARPIDVSADSVTVLGDRDQLRQVVDGLPANVRAHTPPGTHVYVDLRRIDGRAHSPSATPARGSSTTKRRRRSSCSTASTRRARGRAAASASASRSSPRWPRPTAAGRR